MRNRHAEELRRRAEEQLAARAGQIATLERADLVSLAHELAVHQIELEIQNEELVRTRTLAEEARDRYLDLYDFAPVGYFTLDEHNRIAEVNLTGCRLLRAERQDLLNTRFTKFLPEEQADRFYFHRKEVLEGGGRQTCELKMQKADGALFDARLESLRAGEGRLRVAVIDVTERQRAEEALRASEEQFYAFFHIAAVGTAQLALDGRFLEVNDRLCQITGYSREELRRMAPADLTHPEDRRREDECLSAYLQGRTSGYETEKRYVRKDGQVVWVQVTAALIRDVQGKPLRSAEVIQDITERRQAEEALRESEEKYRSIVETAAEGIVIVDTKARMIFANGRWSEIFGYSLEEAGHLTLFDLVFPEDQARMAERWESRKRGVRERYEFRFRRKDGRAVWALGGVTPRFDAEGRFLGTLVMITDITERKRMEEALRELNTTLESRVARRTAEVEHRVRQLQKLTLELSLSEDRERQHLAQVLHDDLQQVLAAARFHLSLLKKRAAQDLPQQEIVATVEEMLKDAIAKSRNLSHELSPVVAHRNDLAETLAWLAGQMQAQHGLVVRVDAPGEMRLQAEAITLFLLRAAQEMLFNVVKHAGVGEARIRVRRRGRCVFLSVSDRGHGFDARRQKETEGFGLFRIRERAELLGGRMRINSAIGKGSTFRIVVPDGPETEGRPWLEVSPERSSSAPQTSAPPPQTPEGPLAEPRLLAAQIPPSSSHTVW